VKDIIDYRLSNFTLHPSNFQTLRRSRFVSNCITTNDRTHSTAGTEYMALQVRFPPSPYDEIRTGWISVQKFVECFLTSWNLQRAGFTVFA